MITLSRSSASLERELQTARDVTIEAVRVASIPIRAAFITDLPAQDMLYVEKRNEAAAFMAETPTPTDLTDYDLLAAEVGITAADATGVAQVYLNLNYYGKKAFAALETPRMAAILAIEQATSQAAIDTALSTFMTEPEAL